MQINHKFPVGCAAAWGAPANVDIAREPKSVRSWLLDPGSLTAKLKAASQSFRVQIIDQKAAPAESHELRFLNIEASETCVIREVLLICDDVPWVFARSVLPMAALDAAHQVLVNLGENPLGEKLFSDPSIRPGPIEVAKFTSETTVHTIDSEFTQNKRDVLWGRRRKFELSQGAILVAEVFLSPAPCYADINRS